MNLCEKGSYFYEGDCFEECPDGTVPNYKTNTSCIVLNALTESGTVLVPTGPTGSYLTALVYMGNACQTDRYGFHTVCLERCPTGSYATADRQCLSCPGNCVQCNATQCLACASSYYASRNGRCLLAAICVDGQYSLADRCVN